MKVPDEEICLRLTEGAYCQYTISEVERYVTEEEWAEMKLGRFSMSADSFGAYQKFIEKTCEIFKCTVEQKKLLKKKLRRFDETLSGLAKATIPWPRY